MKRVQIFSLRSRYKVMNRIFILISGIAFLCSLFFCCDQEDIGTIITKINMEEMARRYLPDFNLVWERPKNYLGKEYVFYREIDKTSVHITVGLYKSEIDAENIADNYHNSISAIMEEGPHLGILIGNKFWWLAPYQDSSILTSIDFIRRNALFTMSSCCYDELKTLAQKIDNDILKGNYINLNNTILLPVIDSITAPKRVLKEGETTKITVYASDPNHEPLEYDAFPIGHYEPDPENVFTLVASPSYISAPFLGSHIYTFIVINESNVVSEAVEFEIIISE